MTVAVWISIGNVEDPSPTLQEQSGDKKHLVVCTHPITTFLAFENWGLPNANWGLPNANWGLYLMLILRVRLVNIHVDTRISVFVIEYLRKTKRYCNTVIASSCRAHVL